MRSMKRRTLAMDRRTYTTNWRTRRISVGPGLRNIGRDRWNVERVQRTVARSAFPAHAINGPLNALDETSDACDGSSNIYDELTNAAPFRRDLVCEILDAVDGPLNAYNGPLDSAHFQRTLSTDR